MEKHSMTLTNGIDVLQLTANQLLHVLDAHSYYLPIRKVLRYSTNIGGGRRVRVQPRQVISHELIVQYLCIGQYIDQVRPHFLCAALMSSKRTKQHAVRRLSISLLLL